MDFTTYKASNDEPDFINYGFINPTLIDVGHENGTYLLTYEWDEYKREDLTDKFYSKEMDEKYPEYGFAKHKGYGTKAHYEALKKYGPSPIHRLTFLKNLSEH